MQDWEKLYDMLPYVMTKFTVKVSVKSHHNFLLTERTINSLQCGLGSQRYCCGWSRMQVYFAETFAKKNRRACGKVQKQ